MKNFKNDFYKLRELFKEKRKNFGIVEGRLSVNRRGFGFVTVEGIEKDIYIDKENLGSAMGGDKVKVQIIKKNFPPKNSEGEVIEILEHSQEIFVGNLIRRGKNFCLKTDNFKIKIVGKFDLKNRDKKVAVKITDWKNLRGEIVEVLEDKGSDISEIILTHGADLNFPQEVQAEAKNIETEPSAAEISKRIDRRDLKIVTIDGEDSKDLDDGVFAKKIDGGYFLGVYIADVSYYVQPKTLLDKEAFNRGTSIYPADRVVPMLPALLSNGICSLNAGENRLAFACEMNLDFSGKVTSYKIFPTVIKVFRRLSYNQVNKFFSGESFELADCADNLNALLEIYKLRKKIRVERGAIDFDIPEIKIILDDFARPVELTKRVSGTAENLIEECMLLANETVAFHTVKNKIPSLYRVHEIPESEKIATFNQLLAHFNLHISESNNNDQTKNILLNSSDVESKISKHQIISLNKNFQKILQEVKNTPAEKVITNFALRTMQQARYCAENLGHFGLAAEFYTHFTSPIRRYPDLIVHRMLRASLENPAEIQKLSKSLDEIAKNSSARERRAIDIERESLDLKTAEFMQKFVGQSFDAVISGVTNFGFFVELDCGVEGLVRSATLLDDFYNYVEEEFALIGEHTGKSFHIGDSVRVKLIEANVELRQITFIQTQ